MPFGDAGLSRVDTRDIAEAAAIALTTNGHDGQTYDVVGPEALTGRGTAESWSRVLGHPVAYGGDDTEAWERMVSSVMPPWLTFDLRLMWEHFQKNGLRAAPGDVERLMKLLGHEPRRFEDYARETAAAWKK